MSPPRAFCACLIATMAVYGAMPSVASEEQNESQLGAGAGPLACQFTGAFTQEKQVPGVSEPIESQGLFLYDCKSGVIWSVQRPEADTLVLKLAQSADKPSSRHNKQAGKNPHAYRIVGDDVQKLKNRQSRFLTTLIMSLMGGDELALNKQFEITTLSSADHSSGKSLRLLPKRRGLKRAIKQIDVHTVDADKFHSPNSEPNMRIAIIDRNAQTTFIEAWRGANVIPAWSAKSCIEAFMPIKACERLFDTPGDQ